MLDEIKKGKLEEVSKLQKERDETYHKITNYESHMKAQSDVIKSLEEKLIKQRYRLSEADKKTKLILYRSEKEADEHEIKKMRQKHEGME